MTGATSGIGHSSAVTLARAGASVVITGRDAKRGNAVVNEIAAAGGQAHFVRADLADMDDVRQLAAHVEVVDMLVNNAGLWDLRTTAQTSEAEFDAMFAVNVKSAFFLTAALAPKMAKRGRGSIVNVSSMASLRGGAGTAAYGASKAAIDALTRAWAVEFGPAGVRVNAVAVGPTRTPATAHLGSMFEDLGDANPLRRPNEAADVANAICYLLSDAAKAITGVVLSVDGGRVAAL
ncbi:short-chain dehydrogenase [Mycobacterium sp. E1747]|nr:short-chain dehydrogenase [Mycobacterium sp. E1747]